MSEFNDQIIAEFRATGGKSEFFGDAPLVIVHTVGAKSGQVREIPLVAQLDGDRKVIFASAAGATSHPAWYYNLVTNPEVDIEFGTDTLPVTAVELSGDERDRYFAAQVEAMPSFGEYEAKAGDRVIPVFALEPR